MKIEQIITYQIYSGAQDKKILIMGTEQKNILNQEDIKLNALKREKYMIV